MTDNPRAELRALTAAFRTHLELRGLSGTLGVPRAPSPRFNLTPTTPPAVSSANAPLVARPVSAPAPLAPAEPATRPDAAAALQLVRTELGDCQRCKLCSGRTNIVFGVGNPNADLVFVGEGPGQDEDLKGEPFVGAAGQLLTRMIDAMGFDRGDVYICNVVKCRPPYNRNPEPDEVAACQPFLEKQLAAIRPRAIVALGKFAAQLLCGELTPISRLRGRWKRYQGIAVMPTFHPAYLLRTPEAKREVWTDLQAVVAALAEQGVTPPRPLKSGR